MKFIAQRCSNVNRGSMSDEPKPKQRKIEPKKGKHLYSEDIHCMVSCDTSSFDQNMKKMVAELSKTNPNHDVL